MLFQGRRHYWCDYSPVDNGVCENIQPARRQLNTFGNSDNVYTVINKAPFGKVGQHNTCLYCYCHCLLSLLFNLSHWGRVTHICIGNLTIIGPDNGLSPGQRQDIIWTNAWILLIGPWGTNFSEILICIQTFSFKKMHLKMTSAKRRPFWPGLNVLLLLRQKKPLYCIPKLLNLIKWQNTVT